MSELAMRGGGRWLVPSLVVVAIAMPLIGFSPTYYLKAWFGTPALKPIVHIHAVALTLWCALLVTQVVLVRTGHRNLHRQLGYASIVLAIAIVVTSILVITGKPRFSDGERAFILTPLLGIVLFGVLYALAIRFRRDPGTHKRLMLLATLILVPAGLGRILPWLGLAVHTPLTSAMGGIHHFYAYGLVLLPLAIFDLVRLRRLHPVTLWVGLVLLLRHPLAALVAYSPLWQNIADRIT
jgi:uncharacterized membrane protein